MCLTNGWKSFETSHLQIWLSSHWKWDKSQNQNHTFITDDKKLNLFKNFRWEIKISSNILSYFVTKYSSSWPWHWIIIRIFFLKNVLTSFLWHGWKNYENFYERELRSDHEFQFCISLKIRKVPNKILLSLLMTKNCTFMRTFWWEF